MAILLSTLAFPGGAIGLLFKIAIACVIVWGICELIKWGSSKTGVPIPRPLIIIFWCVVCIVLIYWLFELVQMIL